MFLSPREIIVACSNVLTLCSANEKNIRFRSGLFTTAENHFKYQEMEVHISIQKISLSKLRENGTT